MAQYRYRHTLDIENDGTLDARAKAILNAAFSVAAMAHAGQSRLKADPQWQYICHPIMVYDIMRRLGEHDPEVLAAAILHDAIEDHSMFRANDIELGDALSKALFAQGIEEISDVPADRAVAEHDRVGENHAIVDRVVALCREVTNPAVYGGDGIKENEQHDRIAGMSFDAKKIKIADQAASLICNLTEANDPDKFSPEKEAAFTDKAHALVVGIVQSVKLNAKEWTTLKPWASFFGSVMLNVLPLIQTNDPKQKAELREHFDFDRLFDSEHYIDIVPKEAEGYYHQEFQRNDAGKKGLTWALFDANGNIARYALWVDWDDPKGDANAIQKKLTSAIRATQLMAGSGAQYTEHKGAPQRVLLMPGDVQPIVDNDAKAPLLGLERVFEVSPPLNATAFATATKRAGALSELDASLLIPVGDEIRKSTTQVSGKSHPRIGDNKSYRFHD